MTIMRKTKSALITSLVALLLCFAMLVGTTFAWFTDSASSTGNIIKSGTLDVKMEWKDATATGTQKAYKDASEGAMFFNELWEPGYVEAKNVKISNIGTLALQYNLNIAANGEVSDLANVIDVYFADGEITLTDRAMTELTKVGTLADILAGMPDNMYGDLGAGASNTVTLALKMREDAGNEYQNKAIGANFSIILIATQDNVESDSFDENYDDIEVPEYVIQKLGGNTYHKYNNGQVVLTSVPYGNAGSSFTTAPDVTVLGQGDKVANGSPVFSKYEPVTSITLNEGLKEIKARAMTGIKALEEVNFPSTLEIIGEQAIAQSAIKELYIPANVKEIRHAAFTSSTKLTTVTIEGNATLDNYMFRGCSSLESIYLLGDDVNFVNTSGNAGFFACRTENGRSFKADGTTPGLTIYVKNATVAQRLLVVMKDCTGYNIKILGDAADGSDATLLMAAKNDAQLTGAINAGASTVLLGDGSYTVPANGNHKTGLAIIGNGNTVLNVPNNGAFGNFCFDGSEVVLENMTVVTTNKTWDGFQNAKSITLNNCTVNGILFLSGNATFNNCEFNIGAYDDTYNVWAYGSANGAYTAEFTECTFNCSGKAVYIDGNTSNGITAIFTDCIFNDLGDDSVVNDKAAIETGTTYGNKYDITVTNCEFNGFTENPKGIPTGTNIWGNKHSMTTDKLNVVIDGVDVY